MSKKIVLMLLSAAVCIPSLAGKKAEDPMKTVGIKYLEENFKTYDAIQKHIHDFAEPGFLEYKSSAELSSHLRDNGFEVEMGVAGIPTAFVATFGSGEPVIGLLGEYDALPGMSQDTSTVNHPLVEGAAGHACGHNLLGTAPLAAAVAVSKWLAQGHEGTIKYFGCPAEEGGGAKAYMTAAGLFDGCSAVFDWHPSATSHVTLARGSSNMRINFDFKGKAAHAGGSPWAGRSALDAVESFNYMMNMMREHVVPNTRIHYMISNGGQAPNVVPEKAQVIYYLRGESGEAVRDLFERTLNAARGAAMGTGTTMSYEIINATYECNINETLDKVYCKNLQKIGGLKLDQREKDFLAEISENSGLPKDFSNLETVSPDISPRVFGGGSTDVGNVSQVVPLARMYYSTTIQGASGHTWQQATIVGTTIGTKAVMNVARIQYLSALDLYTNPAILKAAWDEYYKQRGHDYKFKALQGDRKPPLDYCVGL